MLNANAVSWVADLLRLDQHKINCISLRGLCALKVPELMLLWKELRPHWPPNLATRMKSGVRKQVWVDVVEILLQNDDIVESLMLTRTRSTHHHHHPSLDCLVQSNDAQNTQNPRNQPQPPRPALVTPILRVPPQGPHIASVQLQRPQTHAAPPLPPQPLHRSQPRDPRLPVHTSNIYYHYVPPPHPLMHRFGNSDPVRNPYVSPLSYGKTDPRVSSASTHRMPPVLMSMSMSEPRTANVKVKREQGLPTNAATTAVTTPSHHSACRDDRPLNIHERHVMTALQQMGFQDTTEIMQAIRYNASAGPDACMMWIIKQREEQDEAKKMDAARARSEGLREQVELARKQDDIDRFERATMEELAASVFSTSVVLKHASSKLQNLKNTHSQVLYNFLKLEEKIVKWYKDVSWCYLVDLAESWKSRELCESDLKSTMSELEVSLYSLEKQQGGIPTIFVTKRSDAELRGKPTRPPSCDDVIPGHGESDDDEVVVVVMEPLAKKAKTTTSSRQADVIELL